MFARRVKNAVEPHSDRLLGIPGLLLKSRLYLQTPQLMIVNRIVFRTN